MVRCRSGHAAQSGFVYWLVTYVYFLCKNQGHRKWQPWPVHLRVIHEVEHSLRLLILKSRQLGISWLVAAYALWRAVFRSGQNILLLSQGQDEAEELLAKCRYIYTHLPAWMAPAVGDNSKSAMTFPGLDSAIRALPATEKAGRSEGTNLIICDEWAFHPYAQGNWAAIQPTLSDAATFIGLSTANGRGNFFHTMWDLARRGLSDFKAVFLSCWEAPGRDDAWYARQVDDYKATPHLLGQEHPRSEEEAFILSSGIPAIPRETIERLWARSCPPLRQEDYPRGLLRVWREPQVGRLYACGTDVSYGLDTPDAGVSHILDCKTGLVEATLWGHFPPEELADRTVQLCRHYNNAYLGPEANGVGEFFIRRLQDIGYSSPDKVYHRDWKVARQQRRPPKEAGYITGSDRSAMIAEMREALVGGALQTQDADTVGELGTFVIEKGRPQAAEGAHDDRVMALAIAWQMRQMPIIVDRLLVDTRGSGAGLLMRAR
mgnify:FL=1